MRTPGLYLNGISSVVPETVSVAHAVEQGWCTREQAEAHQMTGAAVAGDRPAPDMALEAAEAVLKQSGVAPETLGALLYADTWHQGPDCWFPQHHLQNHLRTQNALALEVRQGCNGLFCALELANSVVRASPKGSALLVGAENYGTPRIDRWTTGSFVLGDGASAFLLSDQPGFAEILAATTQFIPELEGTHRAGEPLFPPGAATGGDVDLNGRNQLFGEWGQNDVNLSLSWMKLHQKMSASANRLLAEADIDASDLAYACLANLSPDDAEHQWLAELEMPLERTTWEFGRSIGHVGANDCFLDLHHLLATKRIGPGDHVFLGSVGSGVTISCAVVRVLDEFPG